MKIILVIVFIIVFTPIGLIMRFFKVDYMDLNRDSNKNSFWIKK